MRCTLRRYSEFHADRDFQATEWASGLSLLLLWGFGGLVVRATTSEVKSSNPVFGHLITHLIIYTC